MEDSQNVRRGLFFAALAFAAWGLLSPLGKRLLEAFDPMGLNAVRFAIALLAVAPFLGRGGWASTWMALRRPGVWVANVLANLSLAMYVWSLQDLPAAVATVTFYLAPLVTAVGGHFLLRERAGWAFAPAAAAVLAGGYVALFGWQAPDTRFPPGALVLAFLSTAVWAGYSLVMRKAAQGVPGRGLVGSAFVIAFLFFVVATPLIEPLPNLSGISATVWVDMAVYAAMPTVAALALYTLAIQKAPAGPVNLWVGAELVMTFLFAWLLLGETYTLVQLAGAGVVLVGVTAYTAWRIRPQAP